MTKNEYRFTKPEQISDGYGSTSGLPFYSFIIRNGEAFGRISGTTAEECNTRTSYIVKFLKRENI